MYVTSNSAYTKKSFKILNYNKKATGKKKQRISNYKSWNVNSSMLKQNFSTTPFLFTHCFEFVYIHRQKLRILRLIPCTRPPSPPYPTEKSTPFLNSYYQKSSYSSLVSVSDKRSPNQYHWT